MRVFVRQLESDSETLKEISRSFRDRAVSLKLVSFFESHAYPLFGVNSQLLPLFNNLADCI